MSCILGSYNERKSGFTLAEMMVVMLILSIILAAFAPVMTTRNKINSGSPWSYSTKNNSDAYYGTGGNQMAMIGQPSRVDDEPIARLLLNTDSNPLNSNQSHILFRRGTSSLGRLYMDKTNILLSDNYNSISGQANTILGIGALKALTSGNNNTAIGQNVLINSNGSHNTAIGTNSMTSNSTGNENVAVGRETLYLNSAGQRNVAVGNGAMSNLKAPSDNIAIGYNALSSSGYDSTVSDNIAIGTSALSKISSGQKNLALGNNALVSNNTGSNNIALGDTTLQNNTMGIYNLAIGALSLNSNVKGGLNVAVGASALQMTTGSENTAVGVNASLMTASGSNNTAVGVSALSAGGINNNTAIGSSALSATKGSNNTAIGYNACSKATGSYKTCIGANSGPGATATKQTEIVYIGGKPNWMDSANISTNGTDRSVYDAMIVSYNPASTSITKGSRRHANESGPTVFINGNLLVRGYVYSVGRGDDNNENEPIGVLGNKNGSTDGDQIKWYGLTWPSDYFSDSRLKYVGKESTTGLDKIKELKVYNYTFKKDKKKTPHIGVIAQDLEKIFPDAVRKGKDGYLQIRMEDMFYSAVNAIKELDAKVDKVINDVKTAIAKINSVDERVKALEKENKELNARLLKLEKQMAK